MFSRRAYQRSILSNVKIFTAAERFRCLRNNRGTIKSADLPVKPPKFPNRNTAKSPCRRPKLSQAVYSVSLDVRFTPHSSIYCKTSITRDAVCVNSVVQIRLCHTKLSPAESGSFQTGVPIYKFSTERRKTRTFSSLSLPWERKLLQLWWTHIFLMNLSRKINYPASLYLCYFWASPLAAFTVTEASLVVQALQYLLPRPTFVLFNGIHAWWRRKLRLDAMQVCLHLRYKVYISCITAWNSHSIEQICYCEDDYEAQLLGNKCTDHVSNRCNSFSCSIIWPRLNFGGSGRIPFYMSILT